MGVTHTIDICSNLLRKDIAEISLAVAMASGQDVAAVVFHHQAPYPLKVVVGTFDNSLQSSPDDAPTQNVGGPTFSESLILAPGSLPIEVRNDAVVFR